MQRDKWGYPRPWRLWADSMFWLFTLLILVGWGHTFLTGTMWGLRVGQLYLIFIAYYVIGNALMYWFIYDSYRWEHPWRWGWFLGLTLFLPLALPWYLIRRREYLEYFEKRRNLPY